MTGLIDWVGVILLGVLVGAGEIVGRYRDAPQRALFSLPGFLYLAINAIAAGAALGIILIFGTTFGVDPQTSPNELRLTQVLVAGFGAMAFFRTSLFIVRVAGRDIGVGPSSFLQIALNATDQAVDRRRARHRAVMVDHKKIVDIDWDKANTALPTYCLNLMQNLPRDDQGAIAQQIQLLREDKMANEIKVLNMGLLLMNHVGDEVLADAIASLGTTIMTDEAIARQPEESEPFEDRRISGFMSIFRGKRARVDDTEEAGAGSKESTKYA